jgi:hypothetical protein
MKISELIQPLYHLVLQLYPHHFRSEYAAEMSDVFGLSMEHYSREGNFRLIGFILREFSTLPFSILRLYWHSLHGLGKNVTNHGN